MAFITGSRAYGTPGENSDIDLVVKMSVDDAKALRAALGCPSGPVRVGVVNFVITVEEPVYCLWRACNEQLKHTANTEGPVSREDAIEFIQATFANTPYHRFLTAPGGGPSGD